MFELGDILLIQAHLQIPLIHFDCETVFDVLHSQILSDTSQLRDKNFVSVLSFALLIHAKMVGKGLLQDGLWPNRFGIRSTSNS